MSRAVSIPGVFGLLLMKNRLFERSCAGSRGWLRVALSMAVMAAVRIWVL